MSCPGEIRIISIIILAKKDTFLEQPGVLFPARCYLQPAFGKVMLCLSTDITKTFHSTFRITCIISDLIRNLLLEHASQADFATWRAIFCHTSPGHQVTTDLKYKIVRL